MDVSTTETWLLAKGKERVCFEYVYVHRGERKRGELLERSSSQIALLSSSLYVEHFWLVYCDYSSPFVHIDSLQFGPTTNTFAVPIRRKRLYLRGEGNITLRSHQKRKIEEIAGCLRYLSPWLIVMHSFCFTYYYYYEENRARYTKFCWWVQNSAIFCAHFY